MALYEIPQQGDLNGIRVSLALTLALVLVFAVALLAAAWQFLKCPQAKDPLFLEIHPGFQNIRELQEKYQDRSCASAFQRATRYVHWAQENRLAPRTSRKKSPKINYFQANLLIAAESIGFR